MQEKIGYYAGSFYPFTNGHKHVVDEALKVFDKVVIAIHQNPSKNSQEITREYLMAIASCFPEGCVDVCNDTGAIAAQCAECEGASFLIRGIRNSTDYEYEENLAKINDEIFNIPTVYFRAGEYGYVSSSMVRELMKYNFSYKNYVPFSIFKYLQGRD